MKCGKCGALINDMSSVCPGCNTPATELEANNLLIKENINDNGVVIMPENTNNENNVQNSEVSVEPVVEVTPVPVVEVSPVNVTPEVTPAVEPVAETPVVEVTPAPVVEVSPVNVTPEVTPAVEPVAETPVVEVTPAPVVETATVNVTPEVTPAVEPVVEAPVVEVTPAPVVETPTVNVTPEVTPAVEPVAGSAIVDQTPVVDNNIINSVVSDVTPTVTTSENVAPSVVENTSETKSNKSVKIVLILIGLIAVLLIGGLCFYFFSFNKPSNMFKGTLGVFKSKLEDALVDDMIPTEVKFSFNTNLKSTDKEIQEMYDKINKIYLESSVYSSIKDQQAFVDLNAKYDGKLLLGLDTYIEKNLAYIKIDDVFDKYINVDVEDNYFDVGNDSETKNLVNVATGFIGALEDSLNDEYFSKVDKKINLNGKDVDVKANTLVVDEKNIDKLGNSVIDNLKNNKEFLQSYSAINNVSESEVISQLEQMLSEIKSDGSTTEAFKLNIIMYTKGLMNQLVGVGFVVDGTAYDIYFTEEYISVNIGISDKFEKLFDVNIKDNKYECNVYLGEEILSFVVGVVINENPKFEKPNVSNNVKLEDLSDDDMLTITSGLISSEGITTFMTDFEDIIMMLEMFLGGMIDTSVPEYDFDADYDMDFDIDYDSDFDFEF